MPQSLAITPRSAGPQPLLLPYCQACVKEALQGFLVLNLNVGDCDCASRDRGAGQNLATLLNVDDGRSSRCNSSRSCGFIVSFNSSSIKPSSSLTRKISHKMLKYTPVVAEAPVKVTVPKSAKGTRALPDSKSSTIHSALSSWRAWLCEVKVWVTVVPLDTFSTTAVPAVVEVAVTVTMGQISSLLWISS